MRAWCLLGCAVAFTPQQVDVDAHGNIRALRVASAIQESLDAIPQEVIDQAHHLGQTPDVEEIDGVALKPPVANTSVSEEAQKAAEKAEEQRIALYEEEDAVAAYKDAVDENVTKGEVATKFHSTMLNSTRRLRERADELKQARQANPPESVAAIDHMVKNAENKRNQIKEVAALRREGLAKVKEIREEGRDNVTDTINEYKEKEEALRTKHHAYNEENDYYNHPTEANATGNETNGADSLPEEKSVFQQMTATT